MSCQPITQRFLTCLEELVREGRCKSKRHFALSLGYHPQGISEMAAGRRDVPLEIIEKSVAEFRINPMFLFSGKGPHFCNPEDDGLRLRNLTVMTDQKGEERIMHVPYTAQAGYGKLLDDPVFMQELPSFQLPDPQFRSGTYRSFEIAGTSMEPTFKSGDLVIAAFIEPRFWEQALKNNQIFILVTHEEVVIKRIHNKIRTHQVVECISDNNDFDIYEIPASSLVEVWKVRMRMTTHLDPPSENASAKISEQLTAQRKMLEELHHQFSNRVLIKS